MTALAIQEKPQQELTRELMISLFDGKLRERMENLPVEIADLSQAQIEILRKPIENDYKLRERLWILVENAQKAQISHIQTVRLFEGIMSEQRFAQVVEDVPRLAWIMTRPVEDRAKMETLLQKLLTKIEAEVLPKAITDDNMTAFLKLVEFLTNRVHGSVVQRIDGRHLHAHQKVPPKQIAGDDPSKRRQELQDKLAAKDVTPVTSNAD